jgi:hypothetical protein
MTKHTSTIFSLSSRNLNRHQFLPCFCLQNFFFLLPHTLQVWQHQVTWLSVVSLDLGDECWIITFVWKTEAHSRTCDAVSLWHADDATMVFQIWFHTLGWQTRSLVISPSIKAEMYWDSTEYIWGILFMYTAISTLVAYNLSLMMKVHIDQTTEQTLRLCLHSQIYCCCGMKTVTYHQGSTLSQRFAY